MSVQKQGAPADRQAEAAARRERLFSDSMLDSMPGILYFYDASGRFLRWNRNFETVTGYSGEEIARMHPRDLFSKEEWTRVEPRVAQVFESGESSIEASLLAKNGAATPYFFTGRRVVFEGQACLVGVGIDVRERRRAEDLLAESERKYRELVEHANSIILRWTPSGRISFINEFGARFFGYSAEEIVGRHVSGTLVPATESGGRDLRQLIEGICANPEAFEQGTNENIRRNGERAWIAWTNRVVRDPRGQVLELLSIGTDVTERKRAEDARRASDALYRTLFDWAPDGIVIADPQSYYLDANARMCQMLGYSHYELVGLHATNIVVESEIPQIEPALADIQARSVHSREWQFRRKDGSVFPAEVIAATMPDGNLLGMIRDITERKRAEQALRELNENLELEVAARTEELRAALVRAEAADRIKSAFLATMSHELRTPLNSIIGFTGTLLLGLAGPLNAEQTKQLGMVRTSARHLLELINDVLDISKIEAGQLEVRAEPFDLRESLDRVTASVKPQADKKGLELFTLAAPELGALVSDRRRVEQILLNLLNNAVKFTEAGRVTLTADRLVELPASAGGAARALVRLSVTDTGIGIKPADLSKLFQPFRQIDSGLTRHHEGTGLGLAICRRLTELLGGEIRATSEWSRGSAFTVTFPCIEDADP